MAKFTITANAIKANYEGDTSEEALMGYINDAGYGSVEEAAKVCGQTAEQFLSEITVTKLCE